MPRRASTHPNSGTKINEFIEKLEINIAYLENLSMDINCHLKIPPTSKIRNANDDAVVEKSLHLFNFGPKFS